MLKTNNEKVVLEINDALDEMNNLESNLKHRILNHLEHCSPNDLIKIAILIIGEQDTAILRYKNLNEKLLLLI